MAARLYVGNLPYSSTEEELRQLFSQAGTVVSVELPADRHTGRPRGFGFVEMQSDAEAEESARKFDGYSLDNRSIRVEIAQERKERGAGFDQSGGRREGHRSGGHRGRGRAA